MSNRRKAKVIVPESGPYSVVQGQPSNRYGSRWALDQQGRVQYYSPYGPGMWRGPAVAGRTVQAYDPVAQGWRNRAGRYVSGPLATMPNYGVREQQPGQSTSTRPPAGLPAVGDPTSTAPVVPATGAAAPARGGTATGGFVGPNGERWTSADQAAWVNQNREMFPGAAEDPGFVASLFDFRDEKDFLGPVETVWDFLWAADNWFQAQVNAGVMWGMSALPGGPRTANWEEVDQSQLYEGTDPSTPMDPGRIQPGEMFLAVAGEAFNTSALADRMNFPDNPYAPNPNAVYERGFRQDVRDNNEDISTFIGAVNLNISGPLALVDPLLIAGKAAKMGRLAALDNPSAGVAGAERMEQFLKEGEDLIPTRKDPATGQDMLGADGTPVREANIPKDVIRPVTPDDAGMVRRAADRYRPTRVNGLATFVADVARVTADGNKAMPREVVAAQLSRIYNIGNADGVADALHASRTYQEAADVMRITFGDVSAAERLFAQAPVVADTLNRAYAARDFIDAAGNAEKVNGLILAQQDKVDSAMQMLERVRGEAELGAATPKQVLDAEAAYHRQADTLHDLLSWSERDIVANPITDAERAFVKGLMDDMVRRDKYLRYALNEQAPIYGQFTGSNKGFGPGRMSNLAVRRRGERMAGRVAAEYSRAARLTSYKRGLEVENFYDDSPLRRKVSVWRWIGAEAPSRHIYTDGPQMGESSREIEAMLNQMPEYAGKQFTRKGADGNDILVGGIEAKREIIEQWREGIQKGIDVTLVMEALDQRILNDIMAIHDNIPRIELEQVATFTKARQQRILEAMKESGTFVDDLDNGRIIHAPWLKTQLMNGTYLMPWDEFAKEARRYVRAARSGKATGRARSESMSAEGKVSEFQAGTQRTKPEMLAGMATSAYEGWNNVWRPMTLLSLGYTRRNLSEGLRRSAIFENSLRPYAEAVLAVGLGADNVRRKMFVNKRLDRLAKAAAAGEQPTDPKFVKWRENEQANLAANITAQQKYLDEKWSQIDALESGIVEDLMVDVQFDPTTHYIVRKAVVGDIADEMDPTFGLTVYEGSDPYFVDYALALNGVGRPREFSGAVRRSSVQEVPEHKMFMGGLVGEDTFDVLVPQHMDVDGAVRAIQEVGGGDLFALAGPVGKANRNFMDAMQNWRIADAAGDPDAARLRRLVDQTWQARLDLLDNMRQTGLREAGPLLSWWKSVDEDAFEDAVRLARNSNDPSKPTQKFLDYLESYDADVPWEEYANNFDRLNALASMLAREAKVKAVKTDIGPEIAVLSRRALIEGDPETLVPTGRVTTRDPVDLDAESFDPAADTLVDQATGLGVDPSTRAPANRSLVDSLTSFDDRAYGSRSNRTTIARAVILEQARERLRALEGELAKHRAALRSLDDPTEAVLQYRNQGQQKRRLHANKFQLANGQWMTGAFGDPRTRDMVELNASSDNTTRARLSLNMDLEDSLLRAAEVVEHKRIDPGDTGYYGGVARQLNQVSQDPLGQIILRNIRVIPDDMPGPEGGAAMDRAGRLGLRDDVQYEYDTEEAMVWLMTDPQGKDYLRRMRSKHPDALIDRKWLKPEDVEEYVIEVARRIFSIAPDERLRALAAERRIDAADAEGMLAERAANVDGKYPPLNPVIGDRVMQWSDSRVRNAWGRLTNKAMTALGTVPENVVVRQPFYGRRYEVHVKNLAETALKDRPTGTLTNADMERIDKAAHFMATKDTKQWMFTIERRNLLAARAEWLFPFISATQNSLTTMGRLTWRNPVPVAVAAVAAKHLMASDYVDEQGNMIVNIPMPWLPSEIADLVRNQKFSVDRFVNISLPTEFPRPGPIFQIPASAMSALGIYSFDTPPAAMVGIFGEAEALDMWKGLTEYVWSEKGRPSESGLDFLIDNAPAAAWMRGVAISVLAAAGGMDWNATYLNNNRRIMASEGLQAGIEGRDPRTPDEMRGSIFALTMIEAVAKGVFAVPTQPEYRSDFLINEYRRYTNADPFNGPDLFYQQYGSLIYSIASGSSTAGGAIPTAGQVAGLQKWGPIASNIGPMLENTDADVLFKMLAGTAGFNSEAGKEYNPQSLSYLESHNIPGTNTKYRAPMTPEERVAKTRVSTGWQDFASFQTAWDLRAAKDGYPSKEDHPGWAEAKRQYVDGMRNRNPDWWFSQRDFGNVRPDVAKTYIATYLNDPEFRAAIEQMPDDSDAAQVWEGASQFMAANDEAAVALQAIRSAPQGLDVTKTALTEAVKAQQDEVMSAFHAKTAAIRNTYPGWAKVETYYFNDEYVPSLAPGGSR